MEIAGAGAVETGLNDHADRGFKRMNNNIPLRSWHQCRRFEIPAPPAAILRAKSLLECCQFDSMENASR
jgi:hypothetical protein